jgi:alanyl-tRNA synthetase
MRTTAEVREGFLSFFEEKGHQRCPSASLIPRADDHSTLLTSAGMQPQMPYFLGREAPPAPLTTTCQKVFRTPDIDQVGLDTYHLTFFEMLGNFSFGQYFKEGAIAFATEFMRDRLGLDWDRIWVSVHAGDPELKLGPDQEAIDLWERIGVPPERIIPLPSSENFWSVGGPGPCGPDSEIYYDWGAESGCPEGCLPGCSRCERFLEFWNLVFMSYELHPDRTLTPLPKQNIDTGMGLERMARIVQNVPSVYDTDGYQAIMKWIAGASGVAYGDSVDATKAHRVLADHGRGMTFLAVEGITPSNEGRGYVLRRIVRRAVQHGLRIGMAAPFVAELSGAVIGQMADAYPELTEHGDQISRILGAEEERFSETLERGMRLFEEAAGRESISGVDAFTLQATWSSPASAASTSTRVPMPRRWTDTARSHARARARAKPSVPPTSRAPPASPPTSSAGRRPRCSPRSARSKRSATASSWRSSASRLFTRRAAARSPTRASSARRAARTRRCSPPTGSRTTRPCSSRGWGSRPATA